VIVAAEREPPDYSWEYFLECNERKHLSFRREATRRNRRDKARSASVEPERRRRKKISGQLWVLLSFPLFFFSIFFLSTTRCLGLVHPRHFIVSVGRNRPSLIESTVLYLLDPPQPFVCFLPISLLSSFSLIFLSLSSVSSSLISRLLATYESLYFLVTMFWF